MSEWSESKYGNKYSFVKGSETTLVLGGAFNYYVGYVKYITGLDNTLDFGLKVEFYFAKTAKIGFTQDLRSNKDKALLTQVYNHFCSEKAEAVTNNTLVAGENTTLSENDTTQAETRLVVVGQDTEQREELISVTTGTESRTTSNLLWSAAGIGFNATASFEVVTPAVYLNGEVVEIG
jgi:hypothetical protein